MLSIRSDEWYGTKVSHLVVVNRQLTVAVVVIVVRWRLELSSHVLQTLLRGLGQS